MLVSVKTDNLSPDGIDYAVADCEGEIYSNVKQYNGIGMEFPATLYTTSWELAGPIIGRENIRWNKNDDGYYAWIGGHEYIDPLHEPMTDTMDPIKWDAFAYGETLLIACMRCFVALKKGDVAMIPDYLC
jgi:hypothetical protein